jgi:DNA-binding transcriptional MerR regulator
MRVAELSRRTGVPVPTIKYYLREALLPPGERTSPNQARYGDNHVQRLRMIRALVEVGGLSIAAVKEVLRAVDSPDKPVFNVLGAVQGSLESPKPDPDGESWQAARDRVAELIESRGWHAKVDSPPGEALVAALVSLHELGQDDLADMIDDYASACEVLARSELAYVDRRKDIEGLVESMVIGTVFGDVILAAIRRLAHQDAAARLFGAPEPETPC